MLNIKMHTHQHSTKTHTHSQTHTHTTYLLLIHSICNRSSAYREIRFILSVQSCNINPTGKHISLNPVSKVDGILAKMFIYNILQQRLDRLLLAVLRRKRGRSVHEWDCRLG